MQHPAWISKQYFVQMPKAYNLQTAESSEGSSDSTAGPRGEDTHFDSAKTLICTKRKSKSECWFFKESQLRSLVTFQISRTASNSIDLSDLSWWTKWLAQPGPILTPHAWARFIKSLQYSTAGFSLRTLRRKGAACRMDRGDRAAVESLGLQNGQLFREGLDTTAFLCGISTNDEALQVLVDDLCFIGWLKIKKIYFF